METPGFSGRRFSRFGQAALDAGLVPTMKSVIATTAQDNYSVLAIYYGIDALTQLSETGTLEQKRALGKQILEHGVLTVVYDVSQINSLIRPVDRNSPLSGWRTIRILL